MKSISFDRAADHYDATRGFPPGVADLVADSAARHLTPHARILEIGIGTGRIAKPLLRRGFWVVGVDLSPRMMSRLLESLPHGVPRPQLVRADAAELPLASARFDAAVAVHVFHLIAHWRQALSEVRRMLRPAGAFLTGFEWRPQDSPAAELLKQWRQIVGAKGLTDQQPGAREFDEVKAALLETGAVMQEWPVGEWTTTRTIADHIETIEHRTWSSTWAVPDDFFPHCLAELRAWALERYGSLERSYETPRKFVWQKFEWPPDSQPHG